MAESKGWVSYSFLPFFILYIMGKNIILNYDQYILKVHISGECTTIEDSFRIESKKDMIEIIKLIEGNSSYNDAIYKRTIKSMIREWRTHNLLYSLGIQQKRTKSVDLEANQSKLLKVLYAIGSVFYLKF